MVDLRVPVFMTMGRWVVKCPRPGCFNAEQFGRCDDGTVGGLTGTSFHCRPEYGGCDLRCGVEWPAHVEGIEFMVRDRAPSARNWLPGESVDDLLRENIEHGLIPSHELNILDGRVEVLAPIEAPAQRLHLPAGSSS